MSQGSGSGMDLEGNQSQGKKKEQEQQQKRKEEQERELKKLREGEEKDKEKGKGQEEGSKGGDDPAKKPYNATGEAPKGAAPRAEGSGRWGDLPLKEFEEALASGKVKVPKKYEAMIKKYLEMLAKKATEDKR